MENKFSPRELSVGHPTCFIDTETTGLDPKTGDKIIEIGCIEMVDRELTGRIFHAYIDPKRNIPEDAQVVHGLTDEFIQSASNGKTFKDVVDDFLEFIGDSVLAIHNAGFDMGFLDAEFEFAGRAPLSKKEGLQVFDTLKFANALYPNGRNNLNALCKRYGIDVSKRDLHGALLDSQLLAEAYLLMTRTQRGLFDRPDQESGTRHKSAVEHQIINPAISAQLISVAASSEENALHQKLLDRIHNESGIRAPWSFSP